MNVVVTGAGGFIGRVLVRELLRQGHRVTGLDLRSALDRVPPNASARPADVRDEPGLHTAFRGHEVVFHTAALFDLTAPPEALRAVNVEGVRNVCRAAAGAGVRRLVCWGSSSVYGVTDGPSPRAEDSPVPLERLNPYARSKYLGERAALQAGAGGPLEVVVLRPADVYGPGSHKGVAQALYAFKVGLMNAVPGPGTAVHSHVHVDDVARSAIHLSRAETPPGVYNIADRTPIAVADLYALVRGHLGALSWPDRRISLPDRPRIGGRPVFRVPAPLLRAFARWELWRTERGWFRSRWGPHPLATPAGVDFLLGHHVIEASKLFGTGFRPYWPSVRDGIRAVLDRYEDGGWSAFRPDTEVSVTKRGCHTGWPRLQDRTASPT